MGHIVVGVDRSGSMFGPVEDRIEREVAILFRQHGALTIIEFSHEITSVYTSANGNLRHTEFGGGTYFKPLIRKLFEIHSLKPVDAAIIITDGMGRDALLLCQIYPFGLAIINPWKVEKW